MSRFLTVRKNLGKSVLLRTVRKSQEMLLKLEESQERSGIFISQKNSVVPYCRCQSSGV